MEAIAAADGRHAISLDAPTAEDGESSTYLDVLGDADAALAAVDDRLLADHLVRSLDSRARAVLRMRFSSICARGSRRPRRDLADARVAHPP